MVMLDLSGFWCPRWPDLLRLGRPIYSVTPDDGRTAYFYCSFLPSW